jgi:hypothetical protein
MVFDSRRNELASLATETTRLNPSGSPIVGIRNGYRSARRVEIKLETELAVIGWLFAGSMAAFFVSTLDDSLSYRWWGKTRLRD